jgi:hypothetical protein
VSSTRDVRDLLDRAAEGPVGLPPIAELVGRGARRRRTWQAASVGVTAAVTAVVIVIVAGIAGRSTPVPGHRPTPGQHSIGPVGRGPTASQIAHGTWQNLPVPPIKSCGFQSVTSTGNLVILVVSQGSPSCPNAAAAYDSRTNVWTKLSPPPASLRGDLTSSQDIFVSRTTRAVAVLNPRSGTWRSLPAVPASGSLATLVSGTTKPILIGAGPQHDQVFAFDGTTWASRPALPHPGTDIVALSAYSEGETQWAFASEVRTTRDGSEGGLSVLRLGAGGWVREPILHDQPLVVQSVEPFRDGQFVIGDNCLPDASCPQGTPLLGISYLDRKALQPIKESPLMMALTDAVSTGNTIIGLDTDAEVSGGEPNQPSIRPIASAVYDVATGHWLRGPHAVEVDNISGMAWTPRGLVVLGDPLEKCVCSLGGLVLRPAPAPR